MACSCPFINGYEQVLQHALVRVLCKFAKQFRRMSHLYSSLKLDTHFLIFGLPRSYASVECKKSFDSKIMLAVNDEYVVIFRPSRG